MKKETKYTLLSFPVSYLLIVLFLLIIAIAEGGECTSIDPLASSYYCSLGEFFYNQFENAFLVSLIPPFSFFFAPVYLLIAGITFFTTRHIRIKYEMPSIIQSATPQHRVRNSIVWLIFILIFLYLFTPAFGLFLDILTFLF